MKRLLVSGALALVLAATACTPTVHLEAAEHANDPLCAEVSARLPGSIGDLDRVWTDAQATAAWGDPSAVLFTCGLEPPAPSALQCVSFGGVDWLVDDADYPNLRLTTYGRNPAAQVYVNTEEISADAVLGELSNDAVELPQDGECTSADEADPNLGDAPETN